MNDDLRTSFLTYYLSSLGERTRDEAKGTKFGFDWVIYNLELSAGWIPYRLPFLRRGADETSKTKTEAEFGVDLAFLSADRQTLRIFVLKDEVLNNKNWAKHDFDTDIRNASAPNLAGRGLSEVRTVEVVLAYNKDEDHAGVELYERRASAQGTSVGEGLALRFDRWNLSTIVEKVQSSLLSPALLPQKFFSQFSYICSQFGDFRHGSEEWTYQLVPNWRNFLSELLSEKADERCVRLLPVALIVLQEYGRGNKSRETGWIDLMEWGMLAAWNVCCNTERDTVRKAVTEIWYSLYVKEVQRYYESHARDLAIDHSLDRPQSGGFVATVSAGVVAHWHLARIGILSRGYSELIPWAEGELIDEIDSALNKAANWQAGLLNANPSSMRPILDIHHIQLVLTWGVFQSAGRQNDLNNWLIMLVNRLSMRRGSAGALPFIEGRNSLELVFEWVATGNKPPEFCDTSSVFLMCLLELVCSLPETQRDALLEMVNRRLVLGRGDCGTPLPGCEPIDLMLWLPPSDWAERVLVKTLADEGECVTVSFGQLGEPDPTSGAQLADAIEGFVAESREKRQFAYPSEIPMSVIVLACLRYMTPLPPEFWRSSIFVDRTDRDTVTEDAAT